ncbi:MAG TPA: GNAT family protein [Actinomycetota bacterium]|jgi:RimJ/RimL family protein N-acetyltransferase|nr:GNAT family protein [Actinomycetota bacterium]
MLQGKKVELRAIERDDLRTLWEWFNDVEVELPAGGDIRPMSLAQLEAHFDKEVKEDPVTRFGITVDGSLIGWCGLFDWDDARTLRLAVAIGDKARWGQGYGRDAVNTLLDYAFVHRNAHKVWLEVADDNERAIRSYRSCGFIQEGRVRETAWRDGHHVDELVMGILRREWEELRTRESQPTLFGEQA